MSDRDLLMIPGPTEYEPDVLAALGARSRSHVSPEFIAIFGRVLRRLREVFRSPEAQPFVVAGSGTLAMEMPVANLIEEGDRALVIDTGLFGERMANLLTRAGARVSRVTCEPGEVPTREALVAALTKGSFKLVAMTHVDTSTGVLAPVEEWIRLAKEAGALTVVDGVCSAGAEMMRQDAWGADVFLTACQKAMGVPPGLAIVSASPRALAAWRERKAPVRSLYCDWGEWLPVMEAYEAGKPAYFATPPVNLIAALDASLGHLVAEGMDARVARHARMAKAFRAGWRALELRMVPTSEAHAAHTLSALYLPDGLDATLLASVRAEGVVLAGGLHPRLKARTFRVGHMGVVGPNEVLATVGAVSRALIKSGYRVDPAAGVAAAQAELA